MEKILLTIFFVLTSLVTALGQSASQELISTAGDQSSNTGYVMEWSIGETVTGTVSGDVVLSQGFLQGSYQLEGIPDPVISGMKIRLYPNPVNNMLHIDLSALVPAPRTWNLQITGIQGIHMKTLLMRETRYDLDLSSYPQGTYVFRIIIPGKSPETFKIIKK